MTNIITRNQLLYVKNYALLLGFALLTLSQIAMLSVAQDGLEPNNFTERNVLVQLGASGNWNETIAEEGIDKAIYAMEL